MDDKFIEFRFGKVPGGVEVESEGFKGPVCEDLVKKVTERIGQRVSEEYTPDYFESPDATKESTLGG
jgi:hypothetical protein